MAARTCHPRSFAEIYWSSRTQNVLDPQRCEDDQRVKPSSEYTARQYQRAIKYLESNRPEVEETDQWRSSHLLYD